MEPELLLEDVNFDFKKGDKYGDSEISYDPHIAYTLPSQNGAASGKNTPFLLKTDKLELSEEDKEMVEEIKKDSETGEVKKLASNKENNLRRALKERFPRTEGEDYYYGIWVETFDEQYVYFEKDGKTYQLPYESGMNDMVKLMDEEPVEVVRQIKFVPTEMMEGTMMTPEMMMRNLMQMMMKVGDIDMSDEMMEMMKSARENLLSDSEVNISQSDDKSSEITKGENMDKDNILEILKSTEAQEVLKAMVDEKTKDLEGKVAAQEEIAKAAKEELENKKLAEIKKAKADMTEVVKGWSVVEETNIEAVVKALFGNEEADILVSTMQAYEDKLQEVKKNFGETEQGFDAGADIPEVSDKAIAAVDKILKAKQAK